MTAPAYNTPAWEAERAGYIGASDVPAILGVSKFASSYDVWLAKKHGVKQPENEAMLMGHLLEPVVVERYAREFPSVKLETRGTIPHPQYPWLRATIDRYATNDESSYPLEIKTTSAYLADEWGDPWTDQVPDAALVQTQVQLMVLGLPYAHVAVLIGGNDFRAPYVVEADREIQEMVLDTCADFWQRCIVGDDEPEIGGPNAISHFKRKYATHSDVVLQCAPGSADDALIGMYLDAKRVLKQAEADVETTKLAVVKLIAGNMGVEGPSGRITYTETKGRASLDVDGLLRELKVPADVKQRFTRIGNPFRTMRTKEAA